MKSNIIERKKERRYFERKYFEKYLDGGSHKSTLKKRRVKSILESLEVLLPLFRDADWSSFCANFVSGCHS